MSTYNLRQQSVQQLEQRFKEAQEEAQQARKKAHQAQELAQQAHKKAQKAQEQAQQLEQRLQQQQQQTSNSGGPSEIRNENPPNPNAVRSGQQPQPYANHVGMNRPNRAEDGVRNAFPPVNGPPGRPMGRQGLNVPTVAQSYDPQQRQVRQADIRQSPNPRAGRLPNAPSIHFGLNVPTLDPEFTIRPKKFFTVGKVFLTLWTEPAAGSKERSPEDIYSTTAFGEIVVSKIRRFVVIVTGENSCNCAPIYTYEGKGSAKPVANNGQHCIIYTGRLTSGHENSRGPLPPIRVDSDYPKATLEPTSRLDLGKLYPIEYNIKVKPFGIVPPSSRQDLLDSFSRVWQRQLPPQDERLRVSPSGVQPLEHRITPNEEEEEEEEEEDEEDEEDDDDDDDESEVDDDDGDEANTQPFPRGR